MVIKEVNSNESGKQSYSQGNGESHEEGCN